MTMITVMGASGRTGSRIARRLLAAGRQVRALARSAPPLKPLEALGAQIMPGHATDVDYLRRAFSGADAAYVLMPHDPAQPGYLQRQREQGEAIAAALASSGVRRVVALSSIGADRAEGTGVIASLHEQEQRLRANFEVIVEPMSRWSRDGTKG